MCVEDVQDTVQSVVCLFPWLTPYLLVSAIVCRRFRQSVWIAPFWVFCACPVLVLFALLLYLILRTSAGSGPDWGFVGMGTMFILLFSLWEVIPGILLLLCYPRKGAWSDRTVLLCIVVAVVSLIGWGLAIPHLPKRHI